MTITGQLAGSTITAQLDLSAASRATAHAAAPVITRAGDLTWHDGITAQLATPAWEHERRNSRGEWTSSGDGGSRYTGKPLSVGEHVSSPETGDGLVVSASHYREHLRVFHPADGSFSTHVYDPGTGAGPVKDIGELAAGLNAGRTLGSSDSAQALKAGVGDWIGTGNAAGTSHALSGEALQQAVRAAPRNAPELWRGMNGAGAAMKNAGDEFDALHGAQPGFRFHTGMASWSAARDVAAQFARTSGGGTGRQVMLRLEPGSSSLRIDQEAGALGWQAERISRGDFTVTGRSVLPDGTVVLNVRQD